MMEVCINTTFYGMVLLSHVIIVSQLADALYTPESLRNTGLRAYGSDAVMINIYHSAQSPNR